jgi:hypothetical protein
MLLRPSNVLTFLSITACALFFTLICAVLYGTRTENPQLPPLVKEVLPAGRCQCEFSTTFTCDTCLDCAHNQLVSPHAAKDEDRPWVFHYPRDADNYSLDRAQCQAAFPGLFQDIERGRAFRKSMGTKVSEQELSSFELSKGMVRALVFNAEVRSSRGRQRRRFPPD